MDNGVQEYDVYSDNYDDDDDGESIESITETSAHAIRRDIMNKLLHGRAVQHCSTIEIRMRTVNSYIGLIDLCIVVYAIPSPAISPCSPFCSPPIL
jgi:hypothetical protein